MIGLAFVRFVLSRLSRAQAEQVIAAAWACNPYGTLRMSFIVDRQRYLFEDDVLCELLTDAPPASSGLDTLDLFRLYVRTSGVVSAYDWENRDFSIGRYHDQAAIELIDRLPIESLAPAVQFCMDLYFGERGSDFRRMGTLARLLFLSLARMIGTGDQPTIEHAQSLLMSISVMSPPFDIELVIMRIPLTYGQDLYAYPDLRQP